MPIYKKKKTEINYKEALKTNSYVLKSLFTFKNIDPLYVSQKIKSSFLLIFIIQFIFNFYFLSLCFYFNRENIIDQIKKNFFNIFKYLVSLVSTYFIVIYCFKLPCNNYTFITYSASTAYDFILKIINYLWAFYFKNKIFNEAFSFLSVNLSAYFFLINLFNVKEFNNKNERFILFIFLGVFFKLISIVS